MAIPPETDRLSPGVANEVLFGPTHREPMKCRAVEPGRNASKGPAALLAEAPSIAGGERLSDGKTFSGLLNVLDRSDATLSVYSAPFIASAMLPSG
jgi:hypothetical protein